MGMTALLTISSMFGSINSQTPPVSYTTKLDVWMVACITFLFGALVEFTVVVYVKLYLYAPSPSRAAKIIPVISRDRMAVGTKTVVDAEEIGRRLSRTIDKVSLVVSFFAFFVFNVAYWADIIRVDKMQDIRGVAN